MGVCPGLPIPVRCWTGSQTDRAARAFSSAPGSHLQSDDDGVGTSGGGMRVKAPFPVTGTVTAVLDFASAESLARCCGDWTRCEWCWF